MSSENWKLRSGEPVLNHGIPKTYWDLIRQKLSQADSEDSRVLLITVPLKEETLSWIVQTSPEDKTFFAAVHNTRNQLSRFVLNKLPVMVPAALTLTMKWRKQGCYVIKNVIKDRFLVAEPWDETAEPTDIKWWKKHAYIYNPDNPALQDSGAWKAGSFHCWICNYRRKRNTAKQHGDVLICHDCAREFTIHDGWVEPTQIKSWGILKLPVID